MIIKWDTDPITFSIEGRDWQRFNVQAFLDAVKAAIPREEREYDPQTKTWSINGDYHAKLTELYAEHIADTQTPMLF